MFQQIDLALKAVSNLIVLLNWALSENEETASFI